MRFARPMRSGRSKVSAASIKVSMIYPVVSGYPGSQPSSKLQPAETPPASDRAARASCARHSQSSAAARWVLSSCAALSNRPARSRKTRRMCLGRHGWYRNGSRTRAAGRRRAARGSPQRSFLRPLNVSSRNIPKPLFRYRPFSPGLARLMSEVSLFDYLRTLD